MPVGNDGCEKRHENLHFFEILFLEFQETQGEREAEEIQCPWDGKHENLHFSNSSFLKFRGT